MVAAWNEVQALRRDKALREWLGVTRAEFEERGAAWLEWAEQFRRLENTPDEEVGDG